MFSIFSGSKHYQGGLTLLVLFVVTVRLFWGDRSTSVTEQYDQSDNRNLAANEQLFFSEGLGSTINVTDSGAVEGSLNFASRSIDSVMGGFDSLMGGVGALIAGTNNLGENTQSSLDTALGFAGSTVEENANIAAGGNFSTVSSSKNMLYVGGLIAAAIIAARVLKK